MTTATTTPRRSAVIMQWEAAKLRDPGRVIFIRREDWYETYGEDAELTARVSQAAIVRRDGFPMSGFPATAADRFFGPLLRHGHKILLVEEDK